MGEERLPDEQDEKGTMRYADRVFGVRTFRDDLTGRELIEVVND